MKPHMLLLLIAVTMICACQTYIPNLAVDPSFTYQAMTQAEMVIGGVSSNLETLGTKRSDRYAGEMKVAIEKERPGLVVNNAPNLRNKMSPTAYKSMMDEWTATLSISKQHITAIKKAMPNSGYVSFARIEDTSTRVSDTRNPIYENKDDTKKLIGETHNLAAMREMKVTYIVYELASGAEVWNGVVPITETESTTQWHMSGGPKTYTLNYPEFPTVQEAFATASRGFADNLPKKK